MKKSIIMLAAAASIFCLSSCRKVVGEGPVETEERALNNFSGLSVSISGKINFIQAPVYKVQIKAQRNILDVMETYKVGNELIIKFSNNVNVRAHSDITLNISAPSLESLNLSGSAKVTVAGVFSVPNFNAVVSGSGDLIMDSVKVTDKFSAGVSGSGSLKITGGLAKTTNAWVSGSGNVDFEAVKADTAIAKVSGSGSVSMFASQTLDATISGSGNVYYWGNPLVNTHISGSGKVIKK